MLFGIVNSVMKLALLGAFGAMAFTISKYGVGSLVPMAKLMGAFYLTCGLFILSCWGHRPRPASPSSSSSSTSAKELLIVLGTSSRGVGLPA